MYTLCMHVLDNICKCITGGQGSLGIDVCNLAATDGPALSCGRYYMEGKFIPWFLFVILWCMFTDYCHKMLCAHHSMLTLMMMIVIETCASQS